MPVDPDKRKIRELKRALKKRGNKHRRHQLKRNLAENPEDAANDVDQLGRHRSESLNGVDQDGTRKPASRSAVGDSLSAKPLPGCADATRG